MGRILSLGEFASQTALAVFQTRAAARLGLSALIAVAGCERQAPGNNTTEPVLPAAGLIYDSSLGSLMKVCDEGRAIYIYEGSYKAAVGIVQKAPECDGNYLIVEKL